VSGPAPGPDERGDPLVAALHDLLETRHILPIALLRETALDASCIDHGDIDLLLSGPALTALIRRAFVLSQDGRCHMRVLRESADKLQLELISVDLERRIVFDLWQNVWQIDGGERCLRFEDVSPCLTEREGPLLRMPPDLEVSVYVHHLATKRKDLQSPEVQMRLRHYESACIAAGFPELASWVDRLRGEHTVPRELIDQTSTLIRQATEERPWRRHEARPKPVRAGRVRSQWFTPRGAPLVAIVGCDGSGKTSLAFSTVSANGRVARRESGSTSCSHRRCSSSRGSRSGCCRSSVDCDEIPGSFSWTAHSSTSST